MSDNDNVALLGCLTIKEMHAKMNGSLVFSHAERQKKDRLVERIVRDASSEHLALLLDAARQKSRRPRKRKRQAPSDGKQPTHSDRSHHREPAVDDDNEDINAEFFHDEDELHACYARFYHATSNAAVEQGICGSMCPGVWNCRR